MSIRPDVLEEAEHAIGNLFQRMYHVARASRDGLGPYSERLTSSVEDLERVLGLVFDYVTPLDLAPRPVDASKLVASLVTQWRIPSETSTAFDRPEVRGEVLADTRALSRAWQLLLPPAENGTGGSIGPSFPTLFRAECNGERFNLTVSTPSIVHVMTGAEGHLARAVAQRLVEAQGGELELEADGTIRLSLPCAARDR